jgi:hypothetical protein
MGFFSQASPKPDVWLAFHDYVATSQMKEAISIMKCRQRFKQRWQSFFDADDASSLVQKSFPCADLLQAEEGGREDKKSQTWKTWKTAQIYRSPILLIEQESQW